MVLQIIDNQTLVKTRKELIDKELVARQNEPLILGLSFT